MSRRPVHSTEEGARLIKIATVGAILITLAGFSTLSYSFSQDRAQRIACVHNQREMCDAVLAYQADNAGLNPQRLRLARRYYTDRPEHFGRCPVDDLPYTYDPKTGLVTCPNRAHRPHGAS